MGIPNQPLVTVYIPTYNRINLLKRAVKSVQDQTYKNLEIIIVDDCSTDGIGEYYCDTGHDYSRITKSSKEKILSAYETFCREYNLNRNQKKILSFHLLNYGISIPFINMINIFICIVFINKFIFYFYFIKKFFLNTFMMMRGY